MLTSAVSPMVPNGQEVIEATDSANLIGHPIWIRLQPVKVR
jgi:hypothetical protein